MNKRIEKNLKFKNLKNQNSNSRVLSEFEEISDHPDFDSKNWVNSNPYWPRFLRGCRWRGRVAASMGHGDAAASADAAAAAFQESGRTEFRSTWIQVVLNPG